MGFRFRRSIRLAQEVRINLSKSRPSLSIGRPGATMNINTRGVQTTVGLPGSGLSYWTKRTRSRFALRAFVAAVIVLATFVILLALMR